MYRDSRGISKNLQRVITNQRSFVSVLTVASPLAALKRLMSASASPSEVIFPYTDTAGTPTDNMRKYLVNLGSALRVSLSTVGAAAVAGAGAGVSPQACLTTQQV